MAVSGPLQDIRVLDLTHVWAGPLGVRFLSDLGAQVVKVEAPYGRGPQVYPSEPIGGFLGGEAGSEPWNVNAVFNKLHRNRKSLCVDLKQPEGKQMLLQLVAVADVIVENFSARAMPSMGLSYEVLKAANPGIVYVSMPGFGASGPYRDRVAFGPIVEPMSGLSNMLGYAPAAPRNSAMALMDPIAATHAAAAVVEALRHQQATGEGAYVEMSLHEGGVSYSGPWLLDTQLGNTPECIGNNHPNMSPHGIFQCAGEDQWLALCCENDQQWHKLCQLVPELDESFQLSQRKLEQAAIDAVLSRWIRTQEKQNAAQRLQTAGVAAGAVNTAADMLADEQVRSRNFFVPYEQFSTPMPGNPLHIDGLDSAQWSPCPKLGADNSEVLSDWLGYGEEQIAALSEQGVLADKPPA